MNKIELQAERARKIRKKFDQTWSEIAPKLTFYGLVDEAIGQVMQNRRSDKLVTTLAVAGVAWLINTFHVSNNPFKFFKSKTANIKQETKENESSNKISKHH
jgi:hypothetical protein